MLPGRAARRGVAGAGRPGPWPVDRADLVSARTGGEAWILTPAGSGKVRLAGAAGRFSLMVQRVMPAVRYVSVEGPVTGTVPGSGALLREIAARYLPPVKVLACIEFAEAELGEQVAICLRPQRWLTADPGRRASSGLRELAGLLPVGW